MTHSSGAPTAEDVAQLAGVSTATVSYVLSGRRGGTRISADTRRRVREAAVSLNYVPNQSARALRRRTTERVCLVLPHLGAPYFDLLGRELQRAARDNGYSTIICVNEPGEQQRLTMDQLRRRLADGVVFAGGASSSMPDEAYTSLARAGIAVVVVSDDATPDNVDVIRTNASEASRRAIDYLTMKGHRRIGFIGHFLPSAHRYRRYEDYLDGLHAHGIQPDDRLVRSGAASREEAYRTTHALLDQEDGPTAIFAASDVAAVSAILAARDANLRVPDDLAVIGVGNIPEDVIARPSLTTVGPTSVGAETIWDLLFSRLKGEAPPEGRVHLQQWSLILRESA